jgi:hypothetical protein
MDDEDARELAELRAYNAFKAHLDAFLVENGASAGTAALIARHLIWWASVLAKTHGWLTLFVAGAAVVSLVAVLVTWDIRRALGLG